ncbi:MAG: helix-turn-helix domain containing protein [Methylotenera sp.]|nr:helix-turn-helix domain containing protein [Methylotenera sp.]MDD4926138.1 helix-turn-helix domain containing protein [Methylotenera sp.]
MMEISSKKIYVDLENLRIEARRLRAEGLSYINIAEKLGCSRSYASKWCKLNEDEIRPKKRGVKQKIPEFQKNALKIEFKASNLSVRKFIHSRHINLLNIVTLGTIEKYFSDARPKAKSIKAQLKEIDTMKFCQICDDSFPEFCYKVRTKAKERGIAELNEIFSLKRKSENWTKWEDAKKRPLASTKYRVAFLAYYYGFSHGEMLPPDLISSGLYEYLFKLKWKSLVMLDSNVDELIDNLVYFYRKKADEPTSRTFPAYCTKKAFFEASERLGGYFSLFKVNEKESTWKPSYYFDLSGDLLWLMLKVSYRDFHNKNIK